MLFLITIRSLLFGVDLTQRVFFVVVKEKKKGGGWKSPYLRPLTVDST